MTVVETSSIFTRLVLRRFTHILLEPSRLPRPTFILCVFNLIVSPIFLSSITLPDTRLQIS